MKTKKNSNIRRILFILCLVVHAAIHGQDFGRGLDLNDPLFDSSPLSAPLMRGDYSNLPLSASLKDFAPTPAHQGQYGTCTAWASAYAARTILEAFRNKWSSEKTAQNAFSPSFVYNQIRYRNDCQSGASLIEALNLLKDDGDVKLKDFGYDCSREVTPEDKEKALPYKILEYRQVASRSTGDKHKYVKKSLAENKPVVLAIDCPNSLNLAKEVWKPDTTDYREWGRGHAITAIGYDDKKDGGAIEIMNSWGTGWGNNGFTWIKYRDFDYFCKLAFELIDKSTADSTVPDLSGSMLFRESTGNEMKARFNGEYFVTEKSYPSNTLFELRISNNEPAYVYAFSSDRTNKAYKIFPFTERMVAYLPYRQSNVAIPDEDSFNMLDTTQGSSYYCFIYSKNSLNIDSIMTLIEKQKGSFAARVEQVVKDKMVSKNDIDFEYKDKIIFSAKSNKKILIPVIIEIKHL